MQLIYNLDWEIEEGQGKQWKIWLKLILNPIFGLEFFWKEL